ncbi:NDP-hexose 2,3-dehydratase family protein [Streptomyces bohaiensis]|uniref:NDP-hexose 2,3-dehydratase n=1 Tax=Streptomyces bohaiensis TaxID=1431344 RepID=A0ABX1C7K7_9ACTN|nr:NDP-hexose 2,3-dehydratase family protein [Streptomyces bohaiensis]NJQ14058.1 NDP-hexose 2,3-dehydratase [Streptomyces bohaiensis]
MRPGTAEHPAASATRERLARSAAATGSPGLAADVRDWLASRGRARPSRVRRIPLAALDGWRFEEDGGDLAHTSGRFFRVEGVRIDGGPHPFGDWQQPIIRQPEIGLLGILAKEFDGVLHFLMQAKMEPGNPNLLQLSPTVQATRSNYQRAHGGSAVRYLDHFTGDRPGRPLTDGLQSEHGSWFWQKSNRNVVVETDAEVAPDPDFRWFTLGELGALLHHDDLVNMDSRSVLACLPAPRPGGTPRHTAVEIASWLTGERARRRLLARPVPLRSVAGWTREESAVRHREDRWFRVVAVAVESESREVAGWTQPLFEPCGPGVTAFLVRRIGGVPHLLAQARAEPGLLHTVEIAPTVQYAPHNYAHLPTAARPRHADLVAAATGPAVRYSALHSDEGGRFLDARTRCLFVSVDHLDDPAADDPGPGFCWLTPDQLGALTRQGHQVNVQARTLLSVLHTGGVTL